MKYSILALFILSLVGILTTEDDQTFQQRAYQSSEYPRIVLAGFHGALFHDPRQGSAGDHAPGGGGRPTEHAPGGGGRPTEHAPGGGGRPTDYLTNQSRDALFAVLVGIGLLIFAGLYYVQPPPINPQGIVMRVRAVVLIAISSLIMIFISTFLIY